MFYIQKRMEISGAHQLKLPYESKCRQLHGHNWVIVCYLKSETLEHGMVMDFTHIKRKIHDVLDHTYINEVVPEINPTAENIAKWICDQLGEKCYKVEVQESEGNIATYERS